MSESSNSDERGGSMSWWLTEILVLTGIAALVALVVTVREIPSIRRYLRIRSM